MSYFDSWDKCTLCDVNYEFTNQKENDLTPIQGVCGHYFCRLCLSKWYYETVDRTKCSNLKFIKCPLCKDNKSFRFDRFIPNRGVCLALEAIHKSSSLTTLSVPSPSEKYETVKTPCNKDGNANYNLFPTKPSNEQQMNESSMNMVEKTSVPIHCSESNNFENEKNEKKKASTNEFFAQAEIHKQIIQDEQTIADRVQKRNAKYRNKTMTQHKIRIRSKASRSRMIRSRTIKTTTERSRTKKKIESTTSCSSSISTSSLKTTDTSSCLTNEENTNYRVTRSKSNVEKEPSSYLIIKGNRFTNEEKVNCRVTRSNARAEKELSLFYTTKRKHQKTSTMNKIRNISDTKTKHDNSSKSKVFPFQYAKGFKRKQVVPFNKSKPSSPDDHSPISNVSIQIGKTMIRKHFPGHGYFYGKVVGFDDDTPFYLVEYTDGDRETLSRNEVMEYASKYKEHMLDVSKNNQIILCDSDDSDDP